MEATINANTYLSQLNGLDLNILETIQKGLNEMIDRLKSPKKSKKPAREKTIDELIAQEEELTEEEKLRLLDSVAGSWKDMPENHCEELKNIILNSGKVEDDYFVNKIKEMEVL